MGELASVLLMKQCPVCKSSYQDAFSHCPRDGSALVTSVLWSDGSIIKEKYRIVAQAGSGGMASVYKAEHIEFRELRALKVMNAEMGGDEAFIRRFRQEALLARKLQHPNAVRVDDIDKDEHGRPFIIMEYIDGGSLRDEIQLGPMAVERVIQIAGQVASALDAAHILGIIHRDIKPENILLTKSAAGVQAKVADFGIARLRRSHRDSAELTLTNPGWVLGSPAYLSPEQASGLVDDEIDGRSDLYSLGVVMYQMLSGDLPLKADSSAEFLNAHINILPEPLEARCPTVPKPLAELVMSCLSKSREDRPPESRDFIEQLGHGRAWVPPARPKVNAAPTVLRPRSQKKKFLNDGPTVVMAVTEFIVLWVVQSLFAVEQFGFLLRFFCALVLLVSIHLVRLRLGEH